MNSPIRHLMETNVGNSIFNIAPERQSEFDRVLNNFDLIFENQRLWKCCADPAPGNREIFLSRGAIELAWCSSLAHFRYYTRLIKGRRFDKPTEIDPHSDVKVSESLKLLTWAIRCQPPELNQPYLLKSADLCNVKSFGKILTTPKDRFTTFLHQRLGHTTRQQIVAFLNTGKDRGLIRELIVQDLNVLIERDILYGELGLKHLSLHPETSDFLRQQPEGEDVKYANRFLLEDIFPGEIKQCKIRSDYNQNWPSGLPTPQKTPAKESDENVADELCLVTCAFLLHHELAHIRLGHSADVTDEVSMAQEKEADNEAADWLLGGVDVESPLFVKRMLGIVQANLMMTALDLYAGKFGGKTHPYSFDRLTSLLNRFLGSERHVAKALAFAVLDLHFNNSGRKMKQKAFDGPEEALEALCNQLAEEIKSRKPKAKNK